MSCAWLSLLTNVTWLPRVTVMFFGLTALFAIVIVLVPVPPAGGVGDGDVPPPLVEPPPQAATAAASALAATNRQVTSLNGAVIFAVSIDRPLLVISKQQPDPTADV